VSITLGQIAVSTGLLENMTRDEVEAVLAHEMAHVGNGDMVTLTLIQGVVNTFVVFLSRLISNMVATNDRGETSGGMYFIVSMVLQLLFGFLASFIVMWFSRQREYRADAGAAKLVGAPKMIAALQRLKGETSALPKEMTAMGIASEAKDSLLATHPSLDNRIARLKGL
jgi:heat shock protein HtpX